MQTTIKLKRGHTADVLTQLLKEGEPCVSFNRVLNNDGLYGVQSGTSVKEFWIHVGDGSTTGGYALPSANDVMPYTSVGWQALHLDASKSQGNVNSSSNQFSGQVTLWNRGTTNRANIIPYGTLAKIFFPYRTGVNINGVVTLVTDLISVEAVPTNTAAAPRYVYYYLSFADGLSSPTLHISQDLHTSLVTDYSDLFDGTEGEDLIVLGYITLPALWDASADPDLSVISADWTLEPYPYTDLAQVDKERYGKYQIGYPLLSYSTYIDVVFGDLPTEAGTGNKEFANANYIINLVISEYSGSTFQLGQFYVNNKTKSGFRINFVGTADKVILNWTASDPTI